MPLTYKQQFNKKYGFEKDKAHSLKEISDLTGYKLSGLKTIYSKGQGAFYSSPQSVRKHIKSDEEWAQARVYAAVNPKSKAYKIDKIHLVKK
jgi:hypothetical protein|tara:strand:+ start:6435 stop:6710 length:276 start_codon:yes stop_codon:yes gene_type:complete